MPGKKKKARKTKGKSKKKEKAEAETKDMLVTTRKFLKMYSLNCAASNSAQSARIIKSCKESMEEEKPFGKVIRLASDSVELNSHLGATIASYLINSQAHNECH